VRDVGVTGGGALRSRLPSDVVGDCSEHVVDDDSGLVHALTLAAMSAPVPGGNAVLHCELVDLVVVFGLDPVGVSLSVLAQQNEPRVPSRSG
jgi:hypothetical protein